MLEQRRNWNCTFAWYDVASCSLKKTSLGLRGLNPLSFTEGTLLSAGQHSSIRVHEVHRSRPLTWGLCQTVQLRSLHADVASKVMHDAANDGGFSRSSALACSVVNWCCSSVISLHRNRSYSKIFHASWQRARVHHSKHTSTHARTHTHTRCLIAK